MCEGPPCSYVPFSYDLKQVLRPKYRVQPGFFDGSRAARAPSLALEKKNLGHK